MEETQNPNVVSYLFARDPSILSWNGVRAPLDNVKCNLLEDLMEETVKAMPQQEQSGQVQVYLRVKTTEKIDLFDFNEETLICKVPEGSQSVKHVREGDQVIKKYTFSKILLPTATQRDMFDYIVKARLVNFINGRNSTLLTYGASGSGKTFTIVGTAAEPGLVPRALEYLFRTLPRLPEHPNVKPRDNGTFQILNSVQGSTERDTLVSLLNIPGVLLDKTQHAKTYRAMQQRLSNEQVAILENEITVTLSIWVSFAEIYNEQVYDLLECEPSGSRTRLKICNNNGISYIKNLKSINVNSGLEAYQVLQFGLHNLKYASTSVNSHSSRSHSIFTIKLIQSSSEEETKISHFNFCDLAGSERSKKTNNIGERLKESNNINNSLLVLGKCINMIRQSQKQNEKKRVPFRESKLTQLFQKALLGFEDISMIVNINPIPEMFDETIHVLNFSAIAKKIVIEQPKIEKHKKNNRFSQYMQGRSTQFESKQDMLVQHEEKVIRLQHTISDLYYELEEAKKEKTRVDYELRKGLMKEFETVISDLNNQWREKLESCEAEIERLEEEIDNMKAKRPRLEDTKADCSVICLDSSSEELTNTVQKTKNDLKLASVNMEKVLLQNEIEKLTTTVKKVKEDNFELTQTLNDAAVNFREKEEECNKQAAELFELYEIIASKDAELEALRRMKEDDEISDSLEM